MQGVAEAGQVILSQTERRLEITANNVANISTPGFKKQISFSDLVHTDSETKSDSQAIIRQSDMNQGKIKKTGNPLDIAISGEGFFQVRAGENLFYTRQGQFRLAEDGALVNSQGFALQAEGGDLVLNGPSVEILSDGIVLEDGMPVSRINLFKAESKGDLAPVSGSLFSAMDDNLALVDQPMLRQGYVESSNVQMTSEMVTMMAAMRQAETGARLVQVYDDLMGKALGTFGR